MLQEAGFEVGDSLSCAGPVVPRQHFTISHLGGPTVSECSFWSIVQGADAALYVTNADVLLQPDVLGDLTTELERELGKLVKKKYNTDFYALYRYPLAVSLLPPHSTEHSLSESPSPLQVKAPASRLDITSPCKAHVCTRLTSSGNQVCAIEGAALLHHAGPRGRPLQQFLRRVHQGRGDHLRSAACARPSSSHR